MDLQRFSLNLFLTGLIILLFEDCCTFELNGLNNDRQDTNISFSFNPIEIEVLVEEDKQTVEVNISYYGDSLINGDNLLLKATSTDTLIATVSGDNEVYALRIEGEEYLWTSNFTVTGQWLGRTTIELALTPDIAKPNGGHSPLHGDQHRLADLPPYDVAVVRQEVTSDTIFNIMVTCFIVLNNIGFGCVFDLDVFLKLLKKPMAPIIGLILQFIFQPLSAFGIAHAVGLPNELAFGLQTIGSCPGGGQSNIWSLLLDGDVTLSVWMTFTSNILALGMMPMWLLTLGSVFVTDNIYIPFLDIFLNILTLVCPLIVGILTRKFIPKVGKFIAKIMAPFIISMAVVVIGLGTYANSYISEFWMKSGWKVLVSASLLPAVGFIVGGATAVLFKQPWSRVKTISIETACQNAFIAFLVLDNTLEQPESDITIATAMTSMIFQTLPNLAAGLGKVGYKIIGLCKNKLNTNDDEIYKVEMKENPRERNDALDLEKY